MNISPLTAPGFNPAAQQLPLQEKPGATRQAPVGVADPSANIQAQVDQQDRNQPQDNAKVLKEAVDSANELVKPFNGSLQFNIDQDTGKTVIKVLDLSTNEVIKQIPTEDMIALTRALDQLKGLLVKQKA